MKLRNMKIMVLGLMLVLGILSLKDTVRAEEGGGSNKDFESAYPIGVDDAAKGEFVNDEVDRDAYYYRLDIPEKIGNKWLEITMTNIDGKDSVFGGHGIELLENNGSIILYWNYLRATQNAVFLVRIGNGEDKEIDRVRLTPKEIYYIKVLAKERGTKGRFALRTRTIEDDNFGDLEGSEELKLNKKTKGKIEVSNDIDSFYIKLPNNKKECKFAITASNKAYVMLLDEDGIKVSDTYVEKGAANGSLAVVGNGKKYVLRISGYSNNTLDYSIKPVMDVTKKSKIKTTLTSYKKGNFYLQGKTVSAGKVTVKIGSKTYKADANSRGGFIVELNEALKKNQKIKVSVNGGKAKTFKVK